MSDSLFGLMMYAVALLTMGGIYAVLCLGLNIQWGFTGLFNAGIAGFFAIGAYSSALLTAPPTPNHVGGFDLPIPVGLAAAMLFSGIVAYAVGRICLRLRSDYLAMATIGIAEILRLILKNEAWLTNGSRGISNIPRPFEGLPAPQAQFAFLAVVLVIVLFVYVLIQRGAHAPWGRVMRAIRDDDIAASAVGKDVEQLRLQSFVFGSMVMGLGGALMAHSFKFIGPEATEPLLTTFLVWVMLIAGGSGNNRGAVLGAIVIWTIWSSTEVFINATISWGWVPQAWATQGAFLRVFLIGLVLQIVLQRYAKGLLPERTVEISGRARAAAPRAQPESAD